MSTQTHATRWQTILRKLAGRPTPYWRTRLEDEQAPTPMRAAGQQIAFQLVFVFMLSLIVLLPAAYLSMLVFVAPGGLPQIIGAQLAEVCRSTGNCDIRYLLAGYAFAVDFVIVASAFLVITISRASTLDDGASDLSQDLAYIDQRIVSLRDELVMAGIITLPKEERKADD